MKSVQVQASGALLQRHVTLRCFGADGSPRRHLAMSLDGWKTIGSKLVGFDNGVMTEILSDNDRVFSLKAAIENEYSVPAVKLVRV